jgi:hypothetical protein
MLTMHDALQTEIGTTEPALVAVPDQQRTASRILRAEIMEASVGALALRGIRETQACLVTRSQTAERQGCGNWTTNSTRACVC